MKKYIKRENENLGEVMFIDPRTGEVLNFTDQTVYIQTEEQRKSNSKFFKSLGKKKMIDSLYEEYGNFVWNIYTVSQQSFPDLKPSNITRLIYLSTYVGYDGYLVSKNGVPLSKAQTLSLLNLSEREVRSFWKEMTERKIFQESKGRILIDGQLFQRGAIKDTHTASLAQENKFITRLYIGGVRAMYSKATTKSHKTLSYLFQVIPFVNRRYNIVCHNPLETDVELIQNMTLGEFCDIIGYEKSHATRLFNTLFEPQFEVNGKIMTAMRYVVNKSLDKKNYSMFINPRVYYAGNNWSEVEVLGGF